MIEVQWFGHSMWRVRSGDTTIVTDPFSDIGYPLPRGLTAGLVLSSHDHHDHNNISLVQGAPVVYNQPGIYREPVPVEMIPVWHDHEKGSKRGRNLLMKFTIGERTFLHCGDLGHIPGEDVLHKMRGVDVLMVPVGGHYTIDAKEAARLTDLIEPGLVFPMHYKTPALDFPIAGLEAFLKEIKSDVLRIEGNVVNLDDSDFAVFKILVLDYLPA